MSFIHQIEPYVTESEVAAVADYMRSGGWLTEFKQTEHFAGMLAEFLGVSQACIVTSGTTALYLALKAVGVGPGDSVIVPDFTMIATPNTVKWAGAEPILADVDPATLCLDLEKVELRDDTKALIYVPINGRSREMRQVQNFCVRRNLLLIEDACQALGSESGGKKLGTFGDVGVFSFTPHKIITTGQGGAVVTEYAEIAARVAKLKDFHRTQPGVDLHDGIGFNFKFTDLQATVGIEQLKTIAWRIERRRAIWRSYAERLAEHDWLQFLPTDLEQTVPWFADVLLKGVRRDRFIAHLKQRGIGSRVFYPPVHTQKPYANSGGAFDATSNLAERGVWLPSSVQLTELQLDRICDAVSEFDPDDPANRMEPPDVISGSADWLRAPHWDRAADPARRRAS